MKQKILSAKRNYEELTNYIHKNHINSIFIVCLRSIKKLNIYKYLQNLEKEIKITYFNDFNPNPTYESVCKGIEKFKQSESNVILAIGGGSAMDVAKCIKLYSNMDSNINYLKQEIVLNSVDFIAVPTTAGTGSEATKFAVIYYQGEKQSIKDESAIPRTVLFDSSLLETLPLYQKKATTLDALSHSIESMWSVHSNEESKNYSKEAIKIINENLNDYLLGKNVNELMLYASNLAGKAINITQTTAGHAMCYKLTSLYGISHGHAAALVNSELFPYMLEHMDQCTDERGKEYLLGVFAELSNILGYQKIEDAINYLKKLLDELDLYDVDVNEKDMDALVNSVNTVRLGNNPIKLEKKDIKEIYTRLFSAIEKRKNHGSKRIC